MAEYIERENLLVGIGSHESGLDDIIDNLIYKHNLDFLHDNNEDEVRVFAKELISNIKNYIATEPSADVVKVVRCKDCKYCDFFYPIKEKDKEAIPTLYCELLKGDRKENDYCSFGELKEREG